MAETTNERGVKRVWTIGHGHHDFDTIADRLDAVGVQTIVDVRSEPYSRWAPDFSKPALEEEAASAGFGYRWMGRSLGGKPPAEGAALSSGLDELAGLVASSHVVLLCAEGDPVKCHRDRVLAPALAARGYEVVHVLSDGSTTPYQDRLLD